MGNYSRGPMGTTLPTVTTDLRDVYDSNDLAAVLTVNDGLYSIQPASGQYPGHLYKVTILSDTMWYNWTGKVGVATSTLAAHFQIYNNNTADFVTITTNNSTAANTNFTFAGTQAVSVANGYKDGSNVVCVRVYQEYTPPWTGPNWTLAGGLWSPDPSYSSVQLFANPGFDADTDWSKTGGWTIGSGVASDDGTAGNSYIQQTVGTAGIWSRIGATVTAASGGAVQGMTGYDVATNLLDTTGNLAGEMINRVTTDYAFNGTAFNGSIDNAYAYNLTTADLFLIQDFGSQKNIASNITIPTATLSVGGVVARMSDYNNFILAMIYWTGGEYAAIVYTVESGVYSRRVSTTVTYGAGDTLEIRFPSSDSAQMYYNGSTVGSAVDVTTVPAGTKAGGFGTRSTVQITAPVAS